jgi:hypothetical protein
MIKVIDNKIIVPECRRVLNLLKPINKKTAKRDVKIIAHQIYNTTKEWLYADGSLNTFVNYLCLSPNGDRETMLNVVSDLRARLQKIIDDPSVFGVLPWYNSGKPIQFDVTGSMDDKVIKRFGYALFGNNNRTASVAHVFTKSEDVKMQEALNAKYSQNLEDWL